MCDEKDTFSKIVEDVNIPIKKSVAKVISNKRHLPELNEAKLFESIREKYASTSTTTALPVTGNKPKDDLNEIKGLLDRLVNKVYHLEHGLAALPSSADDTFNVNSVTDMVHVSEPYFYTPMSFLELRKRKATTHSIVKRQRWGQWTDWSPCSVSCGKGRKIRWRHCLETCDDAETEMEEKACQLPACGPGKLFGVIQL